MQQTKMTQPNVFAGHA